MKKKMLKINLNVTPYFKNKLNYRPEIDGLRAVAVLSVVGFHFFPNLIRG